MWYAESPMYMRTIRPPRSGIWVRGGSELHYFTAKLPLLFNLHHNKCHVIAWLGTAHPLCTRVSQVLDDPFGWPAGNFFE